MREVLGKVLGSLIRSTFVSMVMFLVALSVITKTFPPDFSQLSKAYDGLQALNRAAGQISNRTINYPQSSAQDVAEVDVENLEKLNQQRAEVGKEIFNHEEFASKSKFQAENPGQDSLQDPQMLKQKISDLERMVLKLQMRVDELESKTESSK